MTDLIATLASVAVALVLGWYCRLVFVKVRGFKQKDIDGDATVCRLRGEHDWISVCEQCGITRKDTRTESILTHRQYTYHQRKK